MVARFIVDSRLVKQKNTTVEETLKRLLAPYQLTFEKLSETSYIILPAKPAPAEKKAASPKPVMEQVVVEVVVTGKVSARNGDGIPGATVLLKGSTLGTTTGSDGKFSLTVPDRYGIIIISYIGFGTKELAIPVSGVLEVTLEEDIKSLSEIVVTGYSKEQKKDIIGSVSVVNTKDLLTTPSGSITTQLQGRAAGVVISSNGTPGSAGKVRIRGFGSFGGSDPLYIIDGVPAGGAGVVNLNPNDIESFQVLKDAASASIYGARAANGVIIITTKTGKPGKSKITVDSYHGVNYISKRDFPEVLNAQENGELYWKSMTGAGRKVGDADWSHPQYGSGPTPVIPEYILAVDNGARIGGAELEALKNGTPAQQAKYASLIDPANYNFATHQIVKSSDTNWADEVFNSTYITNHQVSATGGSEQGVYAVGLNYFSQGNTASRYAKFDRYSLRANTGFNIGKNIRIGENLQIVYQQHKAPQTWASTVMTIHPLIPVWDSFGNPAGAAAPSLGGEPQFSSNPVTETWRNRFDQNTRLGILGNTYLEADLLKGLTARTSFGIDYASNASLDLTQVTYENAQNVAPPNTLTQAKSEGNTWTWTSTLNYSKTVGPHTFKILLGSEAINAYNNSMSATRLNLAIDNDPNFLVLSAGTGAQTNSGSFSRNSLFSLFSRVDYTFNDKYFFNATVRRDQSSRFSRNYRVGYFPSAALGWRISSEEFLKNSTWISDLKVRGSWGIIGNQNGVDNNNQYTIYTNNDNNSYGISGANNARTVSLTPSRLGNINTRWEKNNTLNLGFDAAFFSSKLEINLDWYKKRTTDLLATNLAPFTGPTVTQPAINIGELLNTGLDLGLTQRGSVNGLRYDIGLIFSHYKNKVIRVLDNPLATQAGGNTRIGNATLTKAGFPISYFYGYQIEGFFNTQEEVDRYRADHSTWLTPAVGRWKIKDINGDNKVDGNDRTFLGSPHPDFQTSLNISLAYKNFDFNCFLFWNQGGQVFNYLRYVVDFQTFTTGRSKRMLYESWTPELGDKAKLPKLDLSDSYSSSNITNYFLEDASYVRLKTLQAGYTLPRNLASRLKLDQLRVYVQAQNLFTFTKSTLLDPGVSLSSGGDTSMGVVNTYDPTPKQIIFGISFGL
ncbi:SusC/RagA family TonB-linked outer membrane protein [Larkinella bovis]|uniref:SusC/RagA family TonB-linked outer membrane protein n=1 Tax=Larkinella bovis TaxID=683041 RepID=A0ABW0IBW5_9BACT